MIRKLPPLLFAASLASCASLEGRGVLSQNSPFPNFAHERPSLELAFAVEDQIIQDLPDETQYFGATGTVTNTSQVIQSVPNILVIFSDKQGQKVFSHETRPAKQSIDPGEVLTINAYITGIPHTAQYVDIGWSKSTEPLDVSESDSGSR